MFNNSPSHLSLLEKRKKQVIKFPDSVKSEWRFFQLKTDLIYSEMLSSLDLKNKNILLHCHEAGGLGDISQTFFFAQRIKQFHPNVNITIALVLEQASEEKIQTLFPVDQFNVKFLSTYDVILRDKQFSELLTQPAAVLGVGVGIASAFLNNTPHRTFREYGFDWHAEVTGNMLSMGVLNNEEGISIPKFTYQPLEHIQSPKIKSFFQKSETEYSNPKLYHMYVHDWLYQLMGIYSAAKIESTHEESFTLILPLKNSLQQWFDWKILDKEYLKNLGISHISRVTTNGIETIQIADQGKELKILSDAIPKDDLKILQQHAENLFFCTGDMTFSECIAVNGITESSNPIPVYEADSHKMNFFKNIIDLANQLELKTLAQFFTLQLELIAEQTRIYGSKTPKSISFHQSPPSFDIKDPSSVVRLSINSLVEPVKNTTEKLVALYQDETLHQQNKIFNQFIREHFDVEPRIFVSIHRGLILGNYPELFADENKLWEAFSKKEMDIDQVCSSLKQSLENLALSEKQSYRPKL